MTNEALQDGVKKELGWSEGLKKQLEAVAGTIRGLSIDMVEKANSGHPGLPLGCAELGAYLYGYLMRYNPKNPHWLGRDRFILSAGHGSAFLYSCLHLSGYDLSMDELKNFRQLHSKTPGHPESRDTPGVETTTGPLGQGFGNAVGQALGLKMLESHFPIFDNKVYCLAGDGCIMEGISSEVSSLAGHLVLDNLIVIYDSNKISLDGPLSQSCSENTAERYRSYGFDVYEVDGHSLDAIHTVFSEARANQTRPVLIIAHTIIGKGSPHKAGTHEAHGAPLGGEEIKLTKEALGLPLEPFFVPQPVTNFFKEKIPKDAALESAWNEQLNRWKKNHPIKADQFDKMAKNYIPENIESELKNVKMESPMATRKSSQVVLNKLGELLPQLCGGSADLSGSDMTMMKHYPLVEPGKFEGRNIKYGVREFGMAAMASGLNQTQMILPFIGTFLTFSDYMRNAIRLAALQRQHVIYQFTHDSIFLGEDGPTHQPVEQIASLRAMPHLHVIRPADNNETKMAWMAALQYQGPTAIILSRQNLNTVPHTDVPFKDGLGRGAYIIIKERARPDFTLFATGSEVNLAIEVADALQRKGKDVRVVSMPCWELFDKQPESYRNSITGGDLGKRVSIEAGVSFGWSHYIGDKGISIAVDDFGLSAPAKALAKAYGFTVDQILERLL